MKMKLAIRFAFRFLFLITLLSLSPASSVAELWPAWAAGYRSIAAFTIDSSGSVFLVAPATIYTNGVISKPMILAKFDPNGALEWTTFSMPWSSDSFTVRKVVADNEGGCYVAGAGIVYNRPFIWLQRYNHAGQLLWSVNDTASDASARLLKDISVSDKGRVFLLEVQPATSTNWNFVVTTFDSSGQQLWRSSQGGFTSSPPGVILPSADGCILAGTSTGITNSGGYLVAKLDDFGSVIWVSRHHDTPSAREMLTAITPDSAGNIYVIGKSAPTNSASRCVIVKYDLAGSELWSIQYNPSDNAPTAPVAIATDSEHNVLMTGWSSSNIVTVKFSARGEQLWEALYSSGSGASDYPVAIGTDSDGQIYVGASVSGAAAVLGYSPDGRLFMQNRHSGCGGRQTAIGLIMHDTGELYLGTTDWIIKYSGTPAPELRIDIYRLAAHSVGLLLTGEAGHCYELWTAFSGDTNWTRYYSSMNLTGRVEFPWTSSATAPWRFFRFHRVD